MQRVKLGSYLTKHKNHLKGIKDLNLRPESKKFPRRKYRDKLLDISDISLCNDFFRFDTIIILHTKAIKEKVNKWDYIKLRTSAIQQGKASTK